MPFNGVVAHFTDADPTGTASDFLATIAWGDGQTSLGTVTSSGGGFDVSGTNTYAAAGTYSIQVVIIDSGGATATVEPKATVVPNSAPPLTATGLTLQATAAMPFTGTIATFTDADPAGNISQYTAKITWGDGQVYAGTITPDPSIPGQFDVAGTHTYLSEKSYAVSILITDAGGASATASSTAQVADASLTATGFPIAGTAGTPLAALVATFRDTDPYGQLADYSATVDWGDHQTSSATVTADPLVAGLFDVSATHTYDSGGSYVLSTMIADKGGATVSAPGSAFVAAAPLTASGVTASATEQVPFTGVVATFTDAASGVSAASFKALIVWGDGQSTPGTVSASGTSGFQVSGTHTYSSGGSYPLKVVVQNADGATATAFGTAQVSAPALEPSAVTFAATEGTPFLGLVASFIDPNSSHPSSYYTATISWGDGHVSAGTVSNDPLQVGGFRVMGSNLYAEEGTFSVSVVVQSLSGIQATIASSAIVADAALTATAAGAGATEGTAFTSVIATFTDANPAASPSDFSASITWGDGQSSPGTIVPDPVQPGIFDVRGTNTYAEAGTYSADVVIQDTGGARAEVRGSVTVGDAALTATGMAGTATPGVPFTATVATLTDANPFATTGDFSVTIAWGDGFTSPGTVAAVAGMPGQFSIQGTTTYAQPGPYDVTVTITKKSGAQITAHTSREVASVPDASLTATGVTFFATPGKALFLPVASFRDADPSGVVTDYTAQVRWGDNHVSTGLIVNDPTTPGVFLVRARNTYVADGTYPVQVTITNRGGSIAVAQSSAVVGSGGVPTSPPPVSQPPSTPPVSQPPSPPPASQPPSPPPVSQPPSPIAVSIPSTPSTPPALTLQNGILKVVAPPGEMVRVEFRVLARLASFHNELGLIFLDADGQIDGHGPADPGFLRLALRSPHQNILFRPKAGPGSRRVLTLHGGDQLLLYLVQNSTMNAALRFNPGDLLAQRPLIFLSTRAANPDGKSHTKIHRESRNGFVLSWEDEQSPVSDGDFNDAVLSIRLLPASNPQTQR